VRGRRRRASGFQIDLDRLRRDCRHFFEEHVTQRLGGPEERTRGSRLGLGWKFFK
jgi:hypothetical protein